VVFEDQTSDGANTLFASLEANNGLAVLSQGVINMMPKTLVARPFEPVLSPMMVWVGLTKSPGNQEAEAFVRIVHEVVRQ
jgi:hypothetical protein